MVGSFNVSGSTIHRRSIMSELDKLLAKIKNTTGNTDKSEPTVIESTESGSKFLAKESETKEPEAVEEVKTGKYLTARDKMLMRRKARK